MPDNERQNLTQMIHDMRSEFQAYVREHMEWKERTSKADLEWKNNVTPSIEIMKKTVNFTEGAIVFMKFIGLLAVAIGAIYGLIKWLKS